MRALSTSLFGLYHKSQITLFVVLTLSVFSNAMALTVPPPGTPPGGPTAVTVVNGPNDPVPMGVKSADGNSVVPVSPTTPIPIGTLGANGSVVPVSPTTPIPIGTVGANGSVVPVSPTTPIPVSVNVTTTNPLPVTVTTGTSTKPIAVTSAPLEPVQFSTDLEFFGDFGFGSPVLHVPAGKRFVMEFISLDISFPAGQGRVLGTILHNDDAQGAQHSYALLGVTQDFGIQGIVYIVNQQVRIYVDHAFDFEGFRTIAAFTGTGHAAVSGYLVDIP